MHRCSTCGKRVAMPYALGDGGAWFCDAACSSLARYGLVHVVQMKRTVKLSSILREDDGTPLEEHKQHAFKPSLPLSTVLELRAAY